MPTATEKLQPFKDAFYDEFTSIMQRFMDQRAFKVLSIGEEGVFSSYFDFMGVYVEHMGYGYTYSDTECIEFYFDDEEVVKWFTQHPERTIAENSVFFERVIRQVAHHEYAHLLFTPIAIWDVFPKAMRNYLQEQKINTFPKFAELVESGDEQLWAIIKQNDLMQAQEGLRNIRISQVVNLIKEFVADRDSIQKINGEKSRELMELRITDIMLALRGCINAVYHMKAIPFYPQRYAEFLCDKIFRITGMSNLFYLWNDWDIMEKIFESGNATALGDFINSVLQKIEIIASDYSTLDEMEKEIIVLAKEIDNTNFLHFFDK